MPKKPLNPFEEASMRLVEKFMERLMEDHLFPMMDEAFASLGPDFKRPDLEARPLKSRKRIRVNPVRDFPKAYPHFVQRTAVQTHYDTLQVSPQAEHETIQAAWKSLCVRFHPDKNPGDKRAAERMVRINQAWEILGDRNKRAAYDRTIRA